MVCLHPIVVLITIGISVLCGIVIGLGLPGMYYGGPYRKPSDRNYHGYTERDD